jgi:hypothetical protein
MSSDSASQRVLSHCESGNCNGTYVLTKYLRYALEEVSKLIATQSSNMQDTLVAHAKSFIDFTLRLWVQSDNSIRLLTLCIDTQAVGFLLA